jgi:hypothetical protein
MPGDPGADGVRRQVTGERGEQVEQSLGLGHGQRDGAAIGRRGLIWLVGQDGGEVRGLAGGRDHGGKREGRRSLAASSSQQARSSRWCMWCGHSRPTASAIDQQLPATCGISSPRR